MLYSKIFNKNMPGEYVGYFKDKECTIEHREDGPAREWKNGTTQWILNGLIHREGGAAIEFSNGKKLWFKHGKRHREDGPATELSNGLGDYYLNGVEYTEKDYWAIIKLGAFV